MAGLYLEQFKLGQVIKHPITRTITESDNVLFSVMTLNPQPLHIDFDYASKSEWGKPLVNSLFTLGLMVGISVHDTTLGTTVANLGMTDTMFPHPVFHGDTIRVETEIKAIRESRSKPDRGIVEFEHRAYNQNGDL
ncbi:MaoC family dehydratase, partial [Salmonella enterica subsp. enterica]|nr:MaoC family dehydratase [Salmonella enterica subsp. enterica serovar Enteritidis]